MIYPSDYCRGPLFLARFGQISHFFCGTYVFATIIESVGFAEKRSGNIYLLSLVDIYGICDKVWGYSLDRITCAECYISSSSYGGIYS
jgi:hypothetical protein